MKPLIFLIGYRGSGKTTVAKLLAERLGWQWLDADAVLEERAGKSIRRIFEEDGEPAFRDLESEILEELCKLDKHVIATGGGVVLRPENRERMRAAGNVVWVKADATTLWERMRRDPTTKERRPNLTVGGLEEVVVLLKEREPHYQQSANLIVDCDKQSIEQLLDHLLRNIQ